MSFIDKIKEKTKFVGRPYHNDEEKEAWEESFKQGRLNSLRGKARREAHESVNRTFMGDLAKGLNAMTKKTRRAGRRVNLDMVGTSTGPFEFIGGNTSAIEPDQSFFMPDFVSKKKKR